MSTTQGRTPGVIGSAKVVNTVQVPLRRQARWSCRRPGRRLPPCSDPNPVERHHGYLQRRPSDSNRAVCHTLGTRGTPSPSTRRSLSRRRHHSPVLYELAGIPVPPIAIPWHRSRFLIAAGYSAGWKTYCLLSENHADPLVLTGILRQAGRLLR